MVGVLEDEDYVLDDATATTADLTQLSETMSDSEDEEGDDEEEFAAENRPRPPPDELMFHGKGASLISQQPDEERRDVAHTTIIRPGRSQPDAQAAVQVFRSEPASRHGIVEQPKATKSEWSEPASRHGIVEQPQSAKTSRPEPASRHGLVEKPESAEYCCPEPASRHGLAEKQQAAEACRPEPAPRHGFVEQPENSEPVKPRRAPRHWREMPLQNADKEKLSADRRRLAEEIMGEAATRPQRIRGLVFPRWRAEAHPAAPLLRQYASRGCPVDVGRDWTLEELEAAVARGPHQSSREDDAIAQIQVEARQKERDGFAKIYLWEELKKNLPKKLKLSPLAMIPHKSRKYRAILDLSFQLLVGGYLLPSVNDATRRMAPEQAIDQIGTVLPRIIEAMAMAPEDHGDIWWSKLDIKDGFWRMTCEEGEEWNFAYVLPNHPGEPVEIVVPSALQMGWAESPPFFCAASETARDVAMSYTSEAVGTLLPHPLEHYTLPEHFVLPETKSMSGQQAMAFLQLLEVFVDDFIQMAQTTDPAALLHLSRALLHGIHSVFPPPAITGHSGEDPISLKKLLEGEGLWQVRKEILGWIMDGATRCIELSEKKQAAILQELKTVLRIKRGVPFKRVEKLVGKLRHASIGIPAGKALFGPINQFMAMEPKQIFWDRCPDVKLALNDWKQLIQEAAKEPTHVKELVAGEADYKGTLDASGEGAGGICISGQRELAPIVWQVKWAKEVVDRLVTPENPNGDITNSDLEMAAEVLGWLVLEAVVSTRWAHVGICSDNWATVSWQMRGASKRSRVANRLLRVLAVRLRKNRASPLVTRHMAGERNSLGDIPSRSFGYKAEWHFERDIDFLAYFNKTFPLPNQNCWTGYRLHSAVASKVMRELLMQGSSMDEWRQLPMLGRKFGKSGRPTVIPSEYLRTWTELTSKQSPESQQCLAGGSGKASEESPSALHTFEPGSAAST